MLHILTLRSVLLTAAAAAGDSKQALVHYRIGISVSAAESCSYISFDSSISLLFPPPLAAWVKAFALLKRIVCSPSRDYRGCQRPPHTKQRRTQAVQRCNVVLVDQAAWTLSKASMVLDQYSRWQLSSHCWRFELKSQFPCLSAIAHTLILSPKLTSYFLY